MKNVQDKLEKFNKQFSLLEKEINFSNQVQIQLNPKISVIKNIVPNDVKLLTFGEAYEIYYNIIKKYQKIQWKEKINWKIQQIQLLFFIILCEYLNNKIDLQNINQQFWTEISYYLYIRTPDQCKFKWMSKNKKASSTAEFNSEQDQLLKNILNKTSVQNQNIKWSRVAMEFNKLSIYGNQVYRSPKYLKKYWILNICQIQKGNWKLEQDLILFQAIYQFGKKWSKISKLMKNSRTEFAVKNRYITVIQKQIKHLNKNKKSQLEEVNIVMKILNNIKKKLHLQSKQYELLNDKQCMNQNTNSLISKNIVTNNQFIQNNQPNITQLPINYQNPQILLPSYIVSYNPIVMLQYPVYFTL